MAITKTIIRPNPALEKKKLELILKSNPVKADKEKKKDIMISIPKELLEIVDSKAKESYTNRSQFIREALIEKLSRMCDE